MFHISLARALAVSAVVAVAGCVPGQEPAPAIPDIAATVPATTPSPRAKPAAPATIGFFDNAGGGPNTLTASDLTAGSIRVDVPAGQWRAIRFGGALYPDGVKATVAIASTPSPNASPWVGFSNQVFKTSTKKPIVPPFHQILGFRNTVPDAYLFTYSLASDPPGTAYPEAVVIVGSNGAPTTFYVGVIPEVDVPSSTSIDLGTALTLINGSSEIRPGEPALLSMLKARPTISRVNVQSGTGGFGVSYVRGFYPNGRLLEYRAGPIGLVHTVVASTPGQIDLGRKISMDVSQPMPGAGALSFVFAGISQAGGSVWDYDVRAAAFRRYRTGVYASASSHMPHVGTTTGDDAGFGPMFGQVSSSVLPGTASLKMNYTLVGREGGSVAGYGGGITSTALPTAFLVYAGFANLDYPAIYGWMHGATEFY